jgi:hypothetical protein
MTDRRSTDPTPGDRSPTDPTSDVADMATVSIDRRQVQGERPADERDGPTVDLARGGPEDETTRVDHPVPAPRQPGPWEPAPREAGALPPSYGPPSAQPHPSVGGWPHAGPPPQQHRPTFLLPQQRENPPLPAPGGRGSAALIVFGVLAALVITGGAWALIMLAGGHSPFGLGTTDDDRAAAPSVGPAPRPPTAIAPPGSIAPLPSFDPSVPVLPTDPAPSDGPTGQVRVTWSLYETPYSAVVTTTGTTGSAEVTYPGGSAGGALTRIREDLTLVSSAGRLGYVGSDPRNPDTGEPAASYLPDIFVLSTNDQGEVLISEVCDTSGGCSPATMG